MMSGKMYRFRLPDDHIDSRFVEAYLQTTPAWDEIDRMKTGGSDSGLNLTHDRFRTLSVPVAPLNEQRRIVEAYEELVSDLDAGVAALERVREKLKLYRASILKAAVEGALTAEWRAQHPNIEPASELLQRILEERRCRWEEKQHAKFKTKGQEPPKNWKNKYTEPAAPDTTNLLPLPEGWCWTTVDQLAWSSGYGTSQKCSGTDTGLAVLRIPNIIGGKVDLKDLKYAPPRYSDDDDELVAIGDLLVVRTNGSRTLIGRGAVVHDTPVRPLAFASYLIRLRLIPAPVLLKWISILWESFHVRRWVEARAATSAGQFNISLKVLSTIMVPLPPITEQEVIAENIENQLSVIDHLESDLEAKMKSAQALRQSILRHAFTGQLVPQDPNDELASELLKRIAAERAARARGSVAAKQETKVSNRPQTGRRGRPKKTAKGND
jgi:type I restriction enzyme S subunit